MAKGKESKVQNDVLTYLREEGCIVWKFQATSSNVGVPDIVGCSPSGRMIGIEVKTSSGIISPIQNATIFNLKNRDAITFSFLGYDEFLKKIKEYEL